MCLDKDIIPCTSELYKSQSALWRHVAYDGHYVFSSIRPNVWWVSQLADLPSAYYGTKRAARKEVSKID